MTEKTYPNTFSRVANKELTLGMIWRGLCSSMIHPEHVPEDILREVEEKYAGNRLPNGFKMAP